jgi:hypothetical protein
MSAVPYRSPAQSWDAPEHEPPAMTPSRPRRRWFNRKTAALAAAITCAAGFYIGIQVEKSQLGTPATAAASGTAAGTGTGTGAGAAAGFPGAGRLGGAGAGAGANASIGTISSVNGRTIYLTDPTGNTVKVTLTSSTKLTKSLSVTKSSLHPGDSVVIQGVKNSGGTLVATSVNDSGAGTTRKTSSTSSTATGG